MSPHRLAARKGGYEAARAALRAFMDGWQAEQVDDEPDDDYGAAKGYLGDSLSDFDANADNPFDVVQRVIGEGKKWARDALDSLRYDDDVERTPLMKAAEGFLTD